MGQPNREFLKWASPKQEFPKLASLEFFNWASPFLEFPIWVGQYQEFPIMDLPISGISDLELAHFGNSLLDMLIAQVG